MSRLRQRIRRLRHDDAGVGLVPAVGGVAVFVAFLLFACQLLVDLYATSAVTAVANDAARVVAGASAVDRPSATAEAEAHARAVLGEVGATATFEWSVGSDVVGLRVVADNPSFIPPSLGATLGFDRVDRTVRIRTEALR